MHDEFIKEYESFIEKEIMVNYECDMLYQKTPTFRISYPGNVAVGGFHKDSDYNHSSKEINIFLPFTESKETNTVWYESDGKYLPMNCEIGDYVVWDGANTMHGNKVNISEYSRVSIDFRIMKLSDYNKESSVRKSITRSIKFDIGNYWKIMRKNAT
jgi:ectoine hydroxylase-related dioxygenase (phytanoyl-CoA dioxygenase family)